MSNFINSSNSQYNISSAGYSKEDFQNSIDKSRQTVRTNVEDNSATQVVSGMMGSPEELKKSFAIALPMYYADKYIVDRLNNGTGNKSILAKIANLGDKISSALHLDRVVSSKKLSKIKGQIKSNTFTKYFTDEFSAVPKSTMAHFEKHSVKYADSLYGLFQKIKENPELASKLYSGDALSDTAKKVFESVGPLKGPVTKGYLESIQSIFTKDIIPKLTDEAEINAARSFLESVGEHISQIDAGSVASHGPISENIASVLKFFKGKHPDLFSGEGKKLLSSLASEGAKPTAEETIKAAEEAAAKGIEKIAIKRDVKSLTGALNKAKASSMKMGNTMLGKALAKLSLGTKDALTYGGGLIDFLFVVSTLKDSIKAAKEAPKGEKKSAFAHEFANGYLGFLLFRPSTNLCYRIGGNKYRGMTTEGREALKELVKKTNATKDLSNEAIKVANIQKKLLINGVDKTKVAELAGKSLEEAKTMAASLKGEGAKLKFWEKPLKAMGKLLDVGLDTIKKKHTVKLPVLGEKTLSLPTVKGFAGGLARFSIIMFVLQPLLQKPIEKLVHKIFGEPTQYLAQKKAKEGGAPAPEKNANNVNSQPSMQTSQIAQNPQSVENSTANTSTNLLQKYSGQSSIANTSLSPAEGTLSAENTEKETLPAQNELAPASNEEIPLLGLGKNKKKDSNGDNCSYVPSIEVKVDKKAIKQNEKNAEELADALIAGSDKYLKNSKKFLK